MTHATYNAALMDAETGGNEQYAFEADSGLLDIPAEDVVDRFIRHLETTGVHAPGINYTLDSAVKKKDNRFVLATGSLVLPKGEIPFLLMISAGAAVLPQ